MASAVDPLEIRAERPGDEPGIRRVELSAFPTPDEADLVDRLRESCPEQLSFVALEGEVIVGHLLFTPATGRSQAGEEIQGLGLAPLAVLESHQSRGIGAALMRFGLDAVEKAGYPYVIVLGHPEYYPRFGFERASQFGVACEFPGVDDAAFMLLPFNEGIVESLSGVVHYRKEFSS